MTRLGESSPAASGSQDAGSHNLNVHILTDYCTADTTVMQFTVISQKGGPRLHDSASCFPLEVEDKLTQPRDHLFDHNCKTKAGLI